jgi:hypothetical protein
MLEWLKVQWLQHLVALQPEDRCHCPASRPSLVLRHAVCSPHNGYQMHSNDDALIESLNVP